MDTPLMCEYIATVNTNEAIGLCEKYGCAVDYEDTTHIAHTLNAIIAEENNDTILKEVCELHPDKGLILSMFKKEGKLRFNGCGDCRANKMLHNYSGVPVFSAIGDKDEKGNSSIYNTISQQTNTILLIGVLAVGIAILVKTQK